MATPSSPPPTTEAPRDLSKKFCTSPFRKFETLIDGNVAPCCSIWVEERLGNIDKSSFEEIWNSKAAMRVRESIHDGSFRYCRKDRCTFLIHDTLPERDAITDPYYREIIEKKTVKMDRGPDFLFLAHDVTCNLTCPSCRSGMLVANEQQEARLDVIETTVIKPILTSGNRVEMSVSGQGDPWSSKHYRSILKYVAENTVDLKLNLHTNGILMTPGRWREYQGLEKYKPLLDVSIDACRPWTYAIVRRNGEWSKLEENLRFMAAKRREGVFSHFYINATVQLDNFHELADMVRLGKSLGCDGVRFYMIQNTGGHLWTDFNKKNIADPAHPLHLTFLETLRDPIFDDPICQLYDMHTLRQQSFAARLPSDEQPVESAEQCVEIVQQLLNAAQGEGASALAAHGRWRFPDEADLCLLDGTAIEAMGYVDQAIYRYRECLRMRPEDVNAMVTLGTVLVESGQLKDGVRQLIGAASATTEPSLHDMLANYIVGLTQGPRKVALPMHP